MIASRHLALLALLLAGGAALPACTRGAAPRAPAVVPVRRISVVRPVRKDLTRTLTLPASILALEQATLLAQVAGYLREVRVDKGDQVHAGDVIAEIDAPDVVAEAASLRAALAKTEAERVAAVVAKRRAEADADQAAAEEERARASETLTASILERTRGLRADDAVSVQELEVATAKRDEARQMTLVAKARRAALAAALEEAAARIDVAAASVDVARAGLARVETRLRYATIRAPFDGTVTARFADRGALIQMGTTSPAAAPIATVARMDRMRVQLQVAEPEVAAIHAGLDVSLEVDAYPGREFTARVVRTAESLDPATRTLLVEAEIENPKRELLPGMYAHAVVVLERHPAALAVPARAIVRADGAAHVWVAREGRARLVAVETGIDDGAEVEVLRGLTGTEQLGVGIRAMTDGTPVEPVEADEPAKAVRG